MHNVIYIDDDKDNRNTFATSLMRKGLLSIVAIGPQNFEATVSELKSSKEKLDALILDLRLDEQYVDEQFAQYTAPSLTQAIRSANSTLDSGFSKEFPIMLLTTQKNIGEVYDPDLSSHGLFDAIYFKQNLADEGKTIEQEIAIAIEAYSIISKNRVFSDLLQYDVSELPEDLLPGRFVSPSSRLTTYEIAHYFTSLILKKSGVLINEQIMAARLGVDIAGSNGWSNLLELFAEVRYKGVYQGSYNRWWFADLISWWRNEFPSQKPLINLSASERLMLIKEKTGIQDLSPPSPPEFSTGDKFWTTCAATDVPIDISDGYLIEDLDSMPWHDKQYVSLQAILNRKLKDKGITIHPSEKERINSDKARIG